MSRGASFPLSALTILKRKAPAFSYKANTALEEVADWLTKMVVGVSLVQLNKVPGYLSRASELMSGSYGNALST